MSSTKRKAEGDATAADETQDAPHDILAGGDVPASSLPFGLAVAVPGAIDDPTAAAMTSKAEEEDVAAAKSKALGLGAPVPWPGAIGVKPAPRKRGRKKKTPIDGPGPLPDEGDESSPTDKSSGNKTGDFRGGQEHWCSMLYELLLYKSKHGHTNVKPEGDEPPSRSLYTWCIAQRKHYKLYREGRANGSFLTPDRVAVLDAAGFEWNVRGDAFWKKRFALLKEYKLVHGHTMVPRNYESDANLGEWVVDQRRQYRFRQEGKPSLLSDDRMQKLNALDFTWRIRDKIEWSDRYNELLEFQTENGHCVVPQHYASNKPLGKWVAKQREQYRFKVEGKHSFLTEERIQLMNDIGFVWSVKGRSHKVRQHLEQAAAAGIAPVPPTIGADDKSERRQLAASAVQPAARAADGEGVNADTTGDPMAAAALAAAAAAVNAVNHGVPMATAVSQEVKPVVMETVIDGRGFADV